MFLSLGIRVIDLSGSFRLKDAASYPSWYGFSHANPDLLNASVYGLPEWNAKAIAPAKLIANPGCYPTSVLLALLPLMRAGMLEVGSDIFCDSKSGVTGAGRSAKPELMFSEVTENFRPYSPVTHRHAPEMCQELGWDVGNFTFVPHLLPISRGIISTIYVRFSHQVSSAEIEAEYSNRYAQRLFVRILGGSRLPDVRAVNYTNFCDVGWRLTHSGRRGIIFSAIDNLMKGASGQALQNFNLMHKFDESLGLL
jgi:N-acetyl-gamma-glutamyl-phosphate reductase